jgi:hypothetical protein
VAAQIVLAPREFLLLGQVVEGCREAVRAVFLWHTAQSPQIGLSPVDRAI